MSNEPETPARASLASVDARVARLEQSQAETDGKIGLVQLEQHHLRELMTSRFSTMESHLTNQGQKLDSFIARMEALILDAARQQGDLSATPLGRQLHDRLTKLETKSEITETFLDQLRGMSTAMKWVVGSSGLGLLASVVAVAMSLPSVLR